MPQPDFEESLLRLRLPLPPGILIGLGLAIAVILLLAYLSAVSSQIRAEAAERVTHTRRVMQQLEAIASTAKDVERGQRGYQLTQQQRYLDVYEAARAALPGLNANLISLLADNPALARSVFNRFPYLEPLNHLQVELLRRYRSGDTDELVQRGILLTMSGLASALRNSG